MSKLDELIAELCPDGVEYASIGSLIKRIRERGKDDISVQQVYVVSNSLGIVRAEDYRDNTIHSEDTSNYTIIRKNMFAYNPSRLNIGSIAMLKEEEPGLVSPMYVVFSIDETQIVKEYFEYVLKSPYVMNKINSYKEEGARFRFNFDRWDWIRIPLPPLAVQQEIVRILDNFTDLIAELTAELTARRKQYEYYRDMLLTFDDEVELITELCPDGVEYKRLKDVCTFKRGTSITKKDIVEGDIPVIAGGQEPAYYHNQANRTGETVVISSSGAYAGFVSYWEQPIFVSDAFSVEPNGKILTKYLYYFLKSKQDKIYSLQKAGGVPHVYSTDIAPLKIPLPPLIVQQEIVRILDTFTELNRELNAELEARKKQYEYYLNKLLDFKEVSS